MFSEEQIIRACKKNDKKAQKMLYNRFAPIMLGICMRYALSRPEAEDIMQEGFLKIFLKIKQYQGTGSFEGWMRKIIINTAISNYRKNLKHYYQDDLDNVSDINSYTVSYGEFTKDELLKVIRELSSGYRIIFNMFAIEGYKHKEIAKMLNIDVATSKSQYSRAKKIIRKNLINLSVERTIA